MGELDRLVKGFHLCNDAFWTTFSARLAEIARARETGEVVLDQEYFLAMHHKFPMILYPALRMQVPLGLLVGVKADESRYVLAFPVVGFRASFIVSFYDLPHACLCS